MTVFSIDQQEVIEEFEELGYWPTESTRLDTSEELQDAILYIESYFFHKLKGNYPGKEDELKKALEHYFFDFQWLKNFEEDEEINGTDPDIA